MRRNVLSFFGPTEAGRRPFAIGTWILAVSADEAVVFIDGTGDGAVPPGRRPALAVPVGTEDHVVAVAQGSDATGP
jgi:hypothetical protein